MHARFIEFNYREWNSELPIRQQLLFGCSAFVCASLRLRTSNFRSAALAATGPMPLSPCTRILVNTYTLSKPCSIDKPSLQQWTVTSPGHRQLPFLPVELHHCQPVRFRICKTIDVVTEEREGITHKAEVSQEKVSRGQNSCGRDHIQLMRTRWIQKRSLLTPNVMVIGDICVTAAHGARVCAISMINQNQKNATNSMRWCQFTCEWTGLNRGLAWQKHTLIGLIWLLQSHSCVHKHRFAPINHGCYFR